MFIFCVTFSLSRLFRQFHIFISHRVLKIGCSLAKISALEVTLVSSCAIEIHVLLTYLRTYRLKDYIVKIIEVVLFMNSVYICGLRCHRDLSGYAKFYDLSYFMLKRLV